jgi:hypothetical protein
MIERKRIYIVVKTYPTISEKYAELVCTAGVLEDGSWIRLYPIPFRKLELDQKYKKYTWIEADVERNTSDFRLETYRPTELKSITVETVETRREKVDWDERRRIIFKNKKIFTSLQELLDDKKSKNISLAVFKPTKILDFVVEPTERDWSQKKLDTLKALSRQMNLFQTAEEIDEEFKLVPKIPYRFSYKFADDSAKESTMMIEDWEIGMLYANCLKGAGGDENIAVAKVRQKYLDEFLKKDLHFFLGTTKQFHNIAPNPFIIIGVFYPPAQSSYPQLSFLDT